MSHVERAIYSYLRGIIRGLDILIQRKYWRYGITTLLVALSTTSIFIINDIWWQFSQEVLELILLVEVAFAIALICVALFGFRSIIARKPQLTHLITLIVAGILFIVVYLEFLKGMWLFDAAKIVFYLWMVLLSISFLGLIHSFFAEWYGAAIWAGNPEGRLLFSPIVQLGLLIAAILYVYLFQNLLTNPYFAIFSIFYGLSFLIAALAVYIIPRKEKGNVFGTIISFFYLYSLYHAYTAFIQGVSSPVVVFDTILLTIGALYSIQGMTRRAARVQIPILKRIGEERSILIILALGLGYHVTTMRTFFTEGSIKEIISIYHLGSFIICSSLMIIFILGYFVSKRFQNWLITMPTSQDALKEVLKLYGPQAARMAMSALLNTSKDRAQEVIQGAPDAIAAGRRIFEEVRGWLSGKTESEKDS